MQVIFSSQIKPYFYRIFRKLKIQKSERKIIKCARLESKSNFSNNFTLFGKLA
jgi:hypothetical protein